MTATANLCRWCGERVPPSHYRPRVWCADSCRRARIRAETDLAQAEAEVTRYREAVARIPPRKRRGPLPVYERTAVTFLPGAERRAAELLERIRRHDPGALSGS